MRRVAVWTMITLASISWLVVTWRLREVLFIMLLSLAIAAAMGEPIARLERRGVSRVGSLLLAYTAVFGGLALIAGALVWAITRELDPLMHDVVRGYGEHLPTIGGSRDFWIAFLPPTEQVGPPLSAEQTAAFLSTILHLTIDVGHAAAVFTVAVVLSIYWAPDRLRLERLWLSLLPPEKRGRLRRLAHEVEAEVGAYIRSEAIQTLLAIVALAVGYGLLGLEYPITVAMMAGILWLVPLLGVGLAIVPIVALGLLQSPAIAGVGALYTVAVLAVLEFLVQPRFHRTSHYWGVLLVLMMLVLGDAIGVAGLILAPPAALALQKAIDELLTPSTALREPVSDLETLSERVAAIRARVDGRDDESSPRLQSLLDRLDALLTESSELAGIPAKENEEGAL